MGKWDQYVVEEKSKWDKYAVEEPAETTEEIAPIDSETKIETPEIQETGYVLNGQQVDKSAITSQLLTNTNDFVRGLQSGKINLEIKNDPELEKVILSASEKKPQTEQRDHYLIDAIERGLAQGKMAGLITADGGTGDLVQIAEMQKQIQANKPRELYQQLGQAKTPKEWATAFAKDPIGLSAELITESTAALIRHGATIIPLMASQGGLAGGIAGTAIPGIGTVAGFGTGTSVGVAMGMGQTSLNLEYSGKIIESIEAAGFDVTNPKELEKAFSDENAMKEIRKKALLKGVPVALFDTFSAGIAGRMFAPAKKPLGKVVKWGTELITQGALGAGGEVAGQVAAGEKPSFGAAANEFIGEVAFSPIEIASNKILDGVKKGTVTTQDFIQAQKVAKEFGQVEDIKAQAGLAERLGEIDENSKQFIDAEFDKVAQADERVPEDVPNRDDVVEKIIEKDQIEEQKKSIDPIFHARIDEKMKSIEDEIKELITPKEEVTESAIPEAKVTEGQPETKTDVQEKEKAEVLTEEIGDSTPPTGAEQGKAPEAMEEPVSSEVAEKSILNQETDLRGDKRMRWQLTKDEFNSRLEDEKIEGINKTKSELLQEAEQHLEDTDFMGKDVTISNVKIIGSRKLGTSKNESDLDIYVEYEGSVSEQKLSEILNDKRNRFTIEDSNGEWVSGDFFPVKSSRGTTFLDKAYKKDISESIQQGKYQKAITEGRMTANDAKTIIESAGLKVPKDILDLTKSDKPKPVKTEVKEEVKKEPVGQKVSKAEEKKLEKVEEKAKEVSDEVPLKEQKRNLLQQMDEAIAIIKSANDGEMPSQYTRGEGEEFKKIIDALNKGGFKTGKLYNTPQVVFEIKGDGTFKLSIPRLELSRELAEKEFPEKDLKQKQASKKEVPSPKKSNYRNVALGRGSLEANEQAMKFAEENLAEAKKRGGKKQIEIFEPEFERQKAIYEEAKGIDYEVETNAPLKEIGSIEVGNTYFNEREILDAHKEFGIPITDKRQAEVVATAKLAQKQGGVESYIKQLEKKKFDAQFNMEAKFLRSDGKGLKKPKNRNEEWELKNYQREIEQSENLIELLNKNKDEINSLLKGKSKLQAAKQELKDANDAFKNIGAVYDPKQEAEKQLRLHKALVKYAQVYLEMKITDFKEFVKGVKENIGEIAEDILRKAWDEVQPKTEQKQEPKDKKRMFMKRVEADPSVPKEVKELVTDADRMYKVAANDWSNKQADDLLTIYEKNNAFDILFDDLKDLNNGMNEGVRSMLASKLAKRLSMSGKVNEAKDVYAWMAKQGTGSGQFIQALGSNTHPEAVAALKIIELEKLKKEKLNEPLPNGKTPQEEIDKIRKEMEALMKEEIAKLNERIKQLEEKKKPKEIYGRTRIAKGLNDLKKAFSEPTPGLAIAPKLPSITKALIEIGQGLIEEGKATAENVIEKIQEYLDKNFKGKINLADYKDDVLSGISSISKSTVLEIVDEHYSKWDEQASTLAEKLAQKAGLSEKEADALADKIEAELKAKIKAKATKILSKELGTSKIPGIKRQNKSITEKIIDNLSKGAMNEKLFADLFADKYGFVALDEATMKKLADFSYSLSLYPEGSAMLHRKMQEFNDYLDTITHDPYLKKFVINLANEMFYTNILGELSPPVRSAKGSAMSGIGELLWSAMLNPKLTLTGKSMKALAKGTDMNAIKELMRTGYNPFEKNPESRTGTLQKLINTPFKDLSKAESAAKLFYYLPVKFLRALYATDALVRYPMKEYFATVGEYNKLLTEGMNPKDKAFWRKMHERLKDTKTDEQQAQQQAEQEIAELKKKGEKVSDYFLKQRAKEIIEQQRSKQTQEYSEQRAAKSVLAHTPEGMMGWAYMTALKMTHDITLWNRLIPFLKIPTNAANMWLDWSPYGVKRALLGKGAPFIMSKDVKDRTRSGRDNMTSEERSEQWVKAAIGTMVMATLTKGLADALDDDDENDWIQFSFDGYGDFTLNEGLKKTGWKEYSFRVKNPVTGEFTDWYYYRDSPLALAFANMGYVHDKVKYQGEDFQEHWGSLMAQGMLQSLLFIKEQTYVKSLVDFSQIFQRQGDAPKTIGNFTAQQVQAQLYPSLYKRGYTSYKGLENIPNQRPLPFKEDVTLGLVQRIFRNVPYLEDYETDEAFDALGYPVSYKFEDTPGLPDFVLETAQNILSEKKLYPAWELINEKAIEVPFANPRRYEGRDLTYKEKLAIQKKVALGLQQYILEEQSRLRTMSKQELQEDIDNKRDELMEEAKSSVTGKVESGRAPERR